MHRRIFVCLLFAASAFGQMNMSMNDTGMYLMNLASGTSQNPQSAPMPMIMTHLGSWQTMLMGQAFIVDTQATGPRAGDKLYSTNQFMAMAQHSAGEKATFSMELMLSLEPATITGERYPELFQTGETAYGRPIIDGQHPHNLIMALAFHYTRQLAEHTLLDVYFAPVGDPALGPVAYPHRASASEIPEAPLSHHWQDSTHIADEVITAGISQGKFRIESSGFYGSEPGENRWTIEGGPINSWSARAWYFPSDNWAAQVSVGRLTHPEALEPGDVVRSTASLSYSRPRGSSTSVIWGRNHSTFTQHDLNSYLIESVFPFAKKNYITGRAELVDKDELIVPGIYRIGDYVIGYTRDIMNMPHTLVGLGANFTAYSMPVSLNAVYGNHPVAVNVFLRLRLKN
jgi:hypothetical protein